jgi:hypothetical protein
MADTLNFPAKNVIRSIFKAATKFRFKQEFLRPRLAPIAISIFMEDDLVRRARAAIKPLVLRLSKVSKFMISAILNSWAFMISFLARAVTPPTLNSKEQAFFVQAAMRKTISI